MKELLGQLIQTSQGRKYLQLSFTLASPGSLPLACNANNSWLYSPSLGSFQTLVKGLSSSQHLTVIQMELSKYFPCPLESPTEGISQLPHPMTPLS